MAASCRPVVMGLSKCGPRKAQRSPPFMATPSVPTTLHSSSKCPSPPSWMKVSVCLFICFFICLSIHSFVRLSVNPFVCPAVCPSICLSVCLSFHSFVQLYFFLLYSVYLRYLKRYPIYDSFSNIRYKILFEIY